MTFNGILIYLAVSFFQGNSKVQDIAYNSISEEQKVKLISAFGYGKIMNPGNLPETADKKELTDTTSMKYRDQLDDIISSETTSFGSKAQDAQTKDILKDFAQRFRGMEENQANPYFD